MKWPWTKEHDEIADLRLGLSRLIQRAAAAGATEEDAWSIDLKGCRIRNVPVGDWTVMVFPTPSRK